MKVRLTALLCPHTTYIADNMDIDMKHYRWFVTAPLKFSMFAMVPYEILMLATYELAFVSSYEFFVFRLQIHAAELSVSSEHTEKQKLVKNKCITL